MTVVVPAGLPLIDAARWVGGSCWLELHVHQVLTDVLALDRVPDDLRVALWRVRANRAAVAEEWHRRLPELREFPRETFVTPPPDRLYEEAGAEVPQVAAALSGLATRYADHAGVAVGPADGPVAATLSWARTLLAEDLDALGTGAVPPEGYRATPTP